MLTLNIRQLTNLFCLWLILVIASACRDNPTKVEDKQQNFGIEADAVSIYSSASVQLKALITNKDGSQEDVTASTLWKISPGMIGTVNETGQFLSVNNLTGVETISAQYNGDTASIQIEVTRRADILGLWPVLVNMQAGDQLQFRCAATFQDDQEAWVTDKVSWSIEPGLAASIDQNGLLQTQAGASGMEKVIASYHGWRAVSEVEVQTTYQSRFEMVTIPAGQFDMGDNNGDPDEAPQHKVYTDAFEVGKFEVTNAEYAAFLTEALKRHIIRYNGHLTVKNVPPFRHVFFGKIPDFDVQQFFRFIPDDTPDEGSFEPLPGFEDHPVVYQHWYGAQTFAEFYGFRLPTEAEWEKAARGGQQLEFATEDGSISHDLANIVGVGGRDTYEQTAPVGSFPPNPYGVYDMCGNATEFIRDFYAADYYANSPFENPLGPHNLGDILLRRGLLEWLIRDGSWAMGEDRARCASRFQLIEPHDNVIITPWDGFRVAR